MADGVIVEVGLAAADIDPGSDEGWRWSPASPAAATETGLAFRGSVRPEAVGEWIVGARASTDGGETWQRAAGTAAVVSVAGPDRLAPAAPGTPDLLDVNGERVRFRWAAPAADDIHRYLIMRGAPGEELELLGTTDVEVFLDATVSAGTPYVYAVVAQDTGYNRSAPSAPLEVTAEERVVEVTFAVTVPGHTTPGDSIYLAGGFQGWNPGADPMTHLDDTTWAITLPFEDGTALEYKYTRGSWEAVEKDAGCGEIPNRTLTVEYEPGGVMAVHDAVGKWRDLDACP